jgi:hypothetical protein
MVGGERRKWSRALHGEDADICSKYAKSGGEVEGWEGLRLNSNRQKRPAKPKRERTGTEITTGSFIESIRANLHPTSFNSTSCRLNFTMVCS